MLTTHKRLMLLSALLEDYPDEVVTGYLVDAQISCNTVVGRAYKVFGYGEGELLRSGEIREVIEYEHRWLIKTWEHDCLVIVNFARGGRQSLLYLIDLFETARLAQSHWCLQSGETWTNYMLPRKCSMAHGFRWPSSVLSAIGS